MIVTNKCEINILMRINQISISYDLNHGIIVLVNGGVFSEMGCI